MKFASTLIAAAPLVGMVFGSPLAERGPTPGVRTVDDSDKSLSYQGGGWVHLTKQDATVYGSGTLSYSKVPNA